MSKIRELQILQRALERLDKKTIEMNFSKEEQKLWTFFVDSIAKMDYIMCYKKSNT